MKRAFLVLVLVVTLVMVVSASAAPVVTSGGGAVSGADAGPGAVQDAHDSGVVQQADSDAVGDAPGFGADDHIQGAVELVDFETDVDADADDDALSDETRDAAQMGAEDGLELAQAQGITVTEEQRQAVIDGSVAATQQHQDATVEQIQNATKGAVHGAVLQSQELNATQLQFAVAGSAGGALTQHQVANATQLQSAAWGASHGAVSQHQFVTVEQLQMASIGAAAGAAREAGVQEIGHVAKIQEAAQGAAHGALDHYRDGEVTAVQRQEITIEQVQHAAAGAAAGVLAAQTMAVILEQEQRISVKQVQMAAIGAAKGSLVQKQTVTVEQTQSAAKGAGMGALTVHQIQRVTVVQIQKAALGAAQGSISQSQEATIEQIHAAAVGGAQGVLVQKQKVTVHQIQKAALGASQGAVVSAVQHQVVQIEQIQAAARGAGEGAVTQVQVVNVVQIQSIAMGAASGVLVHAQQATTVQIYASAKRTCGAIAHVIQQQRITITQIQILTLQTAADTTAYAVEQEVDDEDAIGDYAAGDAQEKADEIEPVTGDASVAFDDQTSDGTQVTIDSVSLDEGGFVAVHDETWLDGESPDSVIGVSAYLEPGEHENVPVTLFESVPGADYERDTLDTDDFVLYGVAHHDTNDNQEFDYVTSDGEEDVTYVDDGGNPAVDGAIVTVAEEPTAELVVADQTGDGTTLTVEQATANVPFYLEASYDGETTRSEAFLADDVAANETIELDPPIEEDTTVGVAIHAADDDEQLTLEEIEYTVEEVERTAELTVTDQIGDGTNLTVEHAAASVDYYLEARYDGETVQSVLVDSDTDLENHVLDLDPPIEETTSVEVAVHAVDDDEELISQEIEYTVEPDEPEPTASVSLEDQSSDGTSVVVDETELSDGGFVVIHQPAEDNRVIGVSEYLEPGMHGNVDVSLFEDVPGAAFDVDALDPGEHELVAMAHLDTNENQTFDFVATDGAEDGPYLDTDGGPVIDEATVTVEEAERTAELTIDDQSGDGANLTVAQASANVEFYLEARYDGETVQSQTYDADESVENEVLDLDPPIEEDTTVEVAIHAADDDEELAVESIEYAVDPDEPEPTAIVSLEDQSSDGTSVVVDETELSDGGFVVIHQPAEDNRVIGVSEYLEPGMHGNVPVTLFENVPGADFDEESLDPGEHELVAMAHLDTNENEQFDFVATDGDEDGPYLGEDEAPVTDQATITVEDEPTATLDVTDQTGDGTNLTVTQASATVEFYLDAQYDGEAVQSDSFDADETLENYVLDLTPPIEEDTTVDVALHAVDDDEQLALAEIQYTVDPDEPEPTATVSFDDQESDGSSVVVDETELSEGGFVVIHQPAVDNRVIGVSEYLEPGEHQNVDVSLFEDVPGADFETAELEPGEHELVAMTHLDTNENEQFDFVATDGDEDRPYLDAGGEPVTDEATVSVEEAERTAELTVEDQTGDGTNLTVEQAMANVEFYVDVYYDGEQIVSNTFDADEPVENLLLDLDPPIEEDTTIEVAVHAAEDDEELINQEIEYTVDPDEPEPTATVSFDAQESDGTTVVVDEVTLSEGGFVVIHQPAVENRVIGVSAYLGPGEHEEVPVTLFEDVPGAAFETDELDPGEHEIVAMAHLDTNENEQFDFVATDGDQDGPYVDEDDTPVTDEATVTVEEEAPTATVSFEDQESDGSSVVVDETELSDGGFVVIHQPAEDNRVIGVSEYLEPGMHENVPVTLFEDVPGTAFEADTLEAGEQELVVMAHLDTNDNQAFDFVATGGDEDGPYVDADETPVTDEATVTVEEDVPTASVFFEDQESDGTSVVVDELNVSDGGFVAIYDEAQFQDQDDEFESIVDALADADVDPDAYELVSETFIGVSEYLEPGVHEDVPVTLFDDTLLPDLEDIFDRDALEAGDHELVVAVHLDTNENQAFDYLTLDGEADQPYLDDDGEPVTDEAIVDVAPIETPTPEAETPTPEPETPTPEPETPAPEPATPETPTPTPDLETPTPDEQD